MALSHIVWLVRIALVSLSLALVASVRTQGGQVPCQDGARVVLADTFEGGGVNPANWSMTKGNDLRQAVVDVVNRSGRTTPHDYELRLRADTVGTDDRTVKYVGVVSKLKVELRRKTEIGFEVDWNRQGNGSYLSAGVYLAPTLTHSTPEQERDWLKIEYIGVPPGRNVRSVVAKRTAGRLTLLFTEGWPDQQRSGRYIQRARVKIFLDRGSIQVLENDQPLYQSSQLDLPFASAHVYLQLSSHSNYPARELFFDDVVIKQACESQPRRKSPRVTP